MIILMLHINYLKYHFACLPFGCLVLAGFNFDYCPTLIFDYWVNYACTKFGIDFIVRHKSILSSYWIFMYTKS